jgi:hypothetical protein
LTTMKISHVLAYFHAQTWNAAEPARALGVECKRADAPRMTPSIRVALEDLGLERVAVVYPGPRRYPLGENVEVVPLRSLCTGEPVFPGD